MTIRCIKTWEPEPRLIYDKTYSFVKMYFRNGENHCVISDEQGRFEAPSCFFDEVFDDEEIAS